MQSVQGWLGIVGQRRVRDPSRDGPEVRQVVAEDQQSRAEPDHENNPLPEPEAPQQSHDDSLTALALRGDRLRREMPVNRLAADRQDLRNLLDGVLPGVIQLPREGDLVVGHGPWSATLAPARPCCRQASHGALADQLPLEFSQRPENTEHELAPGGRRVDALGERPEPDLLRLEIIDQGEEVLERPPEPVQTPHNDHIAGTELIPVAGQAQDGGRVLRTLCR